MNKILAEKILIYPEISTPYYLGHFEKYFEDMCIEAHKNAFLSAYTSHDHIVNEIQSIKLRRLLKSARSIRFWKNRIPFSLIQSSNPLRNLHVAPITTKKDLKTVSIFERSNVPLMAEYGVHTSTSGSTGEPFKFYIDKRLRTRQRAVLMYYADLNHFKSAAVVNLWPTYNPNPLFGDLFYSAQTNEILKKVRFDLYKEMNRPGAILQTFPSLLRTLLQYAKADEVLLRPGYLFTSGEDLSKEEQVFFEQSLKCRSTHYYGSREFSIMAARCSHGRYHINEPDLLFEIVDDRNKPCKKDSVGKVVVTGLNSHIAPFIRYHNGDYGKFFSDPCPCGGNGLTMDLIGRSAEAININGGKTISPYALTGVFNSRFEYIQQYQIRHVSPTQFVVYIVPNDSFTEDIKISIISELRSILDFADVKIELTEEIDKSGSKVLQYVKTFA